MTPEDDIVVLAIQVLAVLIDCIRVVLLMTDALDAVPAVPPEAGSVVVVTSAMVMPAVVDIALLVNLIGTIVVLDAESMALLAGTVFVCFEV